MKRNFLRVGVLALAGALSLGLVATTAGAAVLLTESFTYADGDLTLFTGAGGNVSGGVWSNHSGTGFPIQVVSGEVVLNQGSGSREDANTPLSLAQGPSATTWASFKFKLASGALGLFGGDYFAHMRFSGNFIYPARVVAAAPAGGGDFQLGLQSTSSGGTTVFWPSDLSFDTYYTVVTKLNAASGVATMYVDPLAQSSPSISASGGIVGAEVDQYALRQGGGNTCTQIVDDIVVGQSGEDLGLPPILPGASTVGMMLLASLMLGAGAMFVVRRRATVA
jgi:hypothetical protein